ncbi:MAG: hypothetical protein U1C33_05715, partial [Candidatus Cloacimonadaceae bacterium]|nr:hypothetical protein [Candidatus Cloacimonadaceae bacterium]
KGLLYNLDIQPDIMLKCEVKLLRQAVVKLLENSVKFTETGSVSLTQESQQAHLSKLKSKTLVLESVKI